MKNISDIFSLNHKYYIFRKEVFMNKNFSVKSFSCSRTTDKGFVDALNNLYSESSFIFLAIIGVSVLTCAIVIIILLVKLSQSGSNPVERKDIIKELFVVFLCLGLFGSIPIIFTLLRNLVLIQ